MDFGQVGRHVLVEGNMEVGKLASKLGCLRQIGLQLSQHRDALKPFKDETITAVHLHNLMHRRRLDTCGTDSPNIGRFHLGLSPWKIGQKELQDLA